MDLTIANSAIVVKIIPTPGLLPHSFQNSDRYNTASMRSAFHVYVPRSRRTTTNSSRSRITCQCSGPMPCSPQSQTSGLCGKFGNRLFTAMVVRARRKNAGIAGPTSNPCFGQQVNAAMATVASSRVTELSKQSTRIAHLVEQVLPATIPSQTN